MKKLLVLALVLSLMVMVSASALAAVHNFTGDFGNPLGNPQFSGLSWGGWYSIDKDSAGMTARVLSTDDFTAFGFEYYQNDQFFANALLANDDFGFDSVTALKGSYLFDFGLFVGLDYANFSDADATQTIVSPGYRVALGDGGYAAISFDYTTGDEWDFYDSGIVGYDIDVKYFTDNAKIYGGVYIPNEDVAGTDQTMFGIAANFKVNDQLVIGGAYNSNVEFSDVNAYNLGATFALDNLLLEISYDDTTENSDPVIALNGIYSLDKVKFGLQYTKVDSYDDGAVALKFHYSLTDDSNIRLVYRLENDSYDSVLFLRWSQNL